MEEKFKESAWILSQKEIATDVYSMWLQTKEIAALARPGQFILMYTDDHSKLLPRPISICEVNKVGQRLRVVYRVTGENTGTASFSEKKPGESITILGPLGNGFPLKEEKALLIGGGIGIPPMLELAKQLNCPKQIVPGFRDEVFLADELKQYGDVFTATEDGSNGVKGTVLDAIEKNQLDAKVIYACGPTPMLRAISKYAVEHNIECYISMEEHMACGIGACLACVCKSKEKDDYSQVNYKRICKDGPVFLATEVDL